MAGSTWARQPAALPVIHRGRNLGHVPAQVRVGELRLRQPAVSHHLRVLVEAGLVTRERRGTWMWYALIPGALDTLARLLR